MHKPTERVLRVIEKTLEEKRALRLSEYSDMLDIPKGTLFPILSELSERGYLKKSGDSYLPGAELYALASMLYGGFQHLSFIKEEITNLAATLLETCYFGVLDGGNVHYLEKADSPNPLRMLTSVGQRLPAYATGVGKALLLDFDMQELSEIYPSGLSPLTEKTVADIERLFSELILSRERGYVTEVEESTEYIRCIGVPVRVRGKICAALSVAIPIFRYKEEKEASVISMLLASAKRIGDMLERTGTEI